MTSTTTRKAKSNQELRAEFNRFKKEFDELYQIRLNNTRRVTRREFNNLKSQLSNLETRFAELQLE